MNETQKQLIAEAFKRKMNEKAMSQNAASKSADISAATISNVLNGRYELISLEMWQKISHWANFNPGWIIVDVLPNYKRIQNVCKQSKSLSVSKCIVGDPGKGKSEALKAFANTNPDTIYIQCAEFWTKKYFLEVLMKQLGIDEASQGIPERVEAIVSNLRERRNPLIIIDEADKLKDGLLSLWNALFNETLYRCGYVLVGAPYLQDRISKGVRKNKQSYKETYSRLGGRFIALHDLKANEITSICQANGLFDEEIISTLINTTGNDIRKIKNAVEEHQLSMRIKNSNNK